MLEAIKTKLFLIEKQNSLIIATTSQITKDYTDDIKKLIEISKEKDISLINLDEQLKRKSDLISRIEGKLYSIPALEHKILVLSTEFEQEKKKINTELLKKTKNYEKILQDEKKQINFLQEKNKTLNQSCDDSCFLNRHIKNLQKEMVRMKGVIKDKSSCELFTPLKAHEKFFT